MPWEFGQSPAPPAPFSGLVWPAVFFTGVLAWDGKDPPPPSKKIQENSVKIREAIQPFLCCGSRLGPENVYLDHGVACLCQGGGGVAIVSGISLLCTKQTTLNF